MSSLPLVRLEPLHRPCPLEETWAPILARLDARLPRKRTPREKSWDRLEALIEPVA